MKTFVKTAVAVAAALIGSTAMAQGPYSQGLRAGGYGAADFGSCPDGFCGTQAGCTDGSCGVAGCADGACGPMGCPSGSCGVGVPHRHVVPTARSAAIGYATPTAPYYGAGVNATCPNGNCPQPAVSYAAGYRGYPTAPVHSAAANCPNGRCATAPVPRRASYQAPRFNFLGMKF